MPMQWVPPAVFLEHNGVEIYHVYKDDLIEMPPREFWFTWREDGVDGSSESFDVRDLPNQGQHDVQTEEGKKSVLQDAIEAGILTTEGIKPPDCEPTVQSRVEKIEAVFQQFYSPDAEDDEADVSDILADLRHFCDKHSLDFAVLDGHAYAHYSAEAHQRELAFATSLEGATVRRIREINVAEFFKDEDSPNWKFCMTRANLRHTDDDACEFLVYCTEEFVQEAESFGCTHEFLALLRQAAKEGADGSDKAWVWFWAG